MVSHVKVCSNWKLFLLPLLRVKLYKAVHGKELVFADMKPPVSEAENNHRKSFFLHGLMQNLEFFFSF